LVAEWVDENDFEELFSENIDILTSLRDFLTDKKSEVGEGDWQENVDRQLQRMSDSSAITKLSIAISSVMSWLLLNKAANAGEINIGELVKEGEEVITSSEQRIKDAEAVEGISEIVQNYRSKSLEHFEKVKNLFENVKKTEKK